MKLNIKYIVLLLLFAIFISVILGYIILCKDSISSLSKIYNNRNRNDLVELMELSIITGDTNSLNVLINEGANVNFILKRSFDGSEGDSFLQLVCMRGCFQFDREKSACKIDKMLNNYSAIEMANVLIEKRIHINHKNEDGISAIHIASQCGSPELIEFLLDKGADINDQDNEGLTPLMIASTRREYCNYESKVKIIKLLIIKGSDINIKNNNNQDIFDLALHYKKYEIISILNRLIKERVESDK